MKLLTSKNEEELQDEIKRRYQNKRDINAFKEAEQKKLNSYRTQRLNLLEEQEQILQKLHSIEDDEQMKKAIEDLQKPKKNNNARYIEHLLRQTAWGMLWFLLYSGISLLFRLNSDIIFTMMLRHPMLEIFIKSMTIIGVIFVVLLYIAFGARSPRTWIPFGYLKGDTFLVGICTGSIVSYIIGQLEPLPGTILPYIDRIFMIIFATFLAYMFISCIIGYMLHNKKEDLSYAYQDSAIDRPIELIEEDMLQRKRFAMHLVSYLNRHEKGGYSVGIMGEWGSGKSSVFNFLQSFLPDDTIQINFKPWYFGKDNHNIIQNFLEQMSEKLRTTFFYKPKLERELAAYAKLFSSIQMKQGFITFSFKDIIDRTISSGDTSLTQLKGEIEHSLRQLDRPIYVFIDDLDRLDPQEIQTILKMIRLVADFPNITYILALDENIIVKSLQGMYQQDPNENTSEQARRYLEKFIQLPVYLPRVGQTELGELAWNMLTSLMKDLDKTMINIDKSVLTKYITRLKYNIRTLKRLMNMWELMIGMLDQEVELKDLLLLLMVKVNKPNLYDYIYANSTYFLEHQADVEKERVRFITLFPDYPIYEDLLKELLPYSEQLWNPDYKIKLNLVRDSQLSITNSRVFNRYFQYGLPEKEASNKQIDGLLSALENSDKKSILKTYSDFMNLFTPDQTNDAIRRRISKFHDSKTKLSQLLLAVSLRFSSLYDKDKLSYTAEQSSLVGLTRDLIIYVPQEALLSFIKYANIALSAHVYRFAARKRTDLQQQLQSTMKANLSSELRSPPSQKYLSEDAHLIFTLWRELENEDNIKKSVENWISDTNSLSNFLEYALPISKIQFIDYTTHVYLYNQVVELLKVLPAKRLSNLLIPLIQLPDQLEKLQPLQETNDEQLNLKAFSYAYHTLSNFVAMKLCEIIENAQLAKEIGPPNQAVIKLAENIHLFPNSKEREKVKNLQQQLHNLI
ncbi:hypothetical protein HP548_04130 [Paenibacillus taichungensis]|uniref:KAP NTPase domain-containing protein n=1 Tax=Paenibacillus taichungensis TaxID=484184 RepID=A0ABX2MIW1_9BACL|nr:P-loop NTPase fold protein [Paenibacillus taichungensis]NUU53277.1 hypothetical protein [Paenibacillus taichungensis]